MSLNPYRRSPTWDKITQLIEERNRKMEEVRQLYEEVREIDKLISQLRGHFKSAISPERRKSAKPAGNDDDHNSAA